MSDEKRFRFVIECHGAKNLDEAVDNLEAMLNYNASQLDFYEIEEERPPRFKIGDRVLIPSKGNRVFEVDYNFIKTRTRYYRIKELEERGGHVLSGLYHESEVEAAE